MRKACFCAALVISHVFAFAAGTPFVGTWKLNVQRSKFVNQNPTSASYIVRAEGDQLVWDWEGSGKDPATGSISHAGSHTSARLDGTPAVMNTPIYDHVSMKLKDPRTIDVTFTKDGKFVRQDQFTVSDDGKTLTVRKGVTNALIVYDKQ